MKAMTSTKRTNTAMTSTRRTSTVMTSTMRTNTVTAMKGTTTVRWILIFLGFDPIRVKVAVNEIAARLSAIDPDNASVYLQNASEYGEKLDELHAWIQEQVSAVEPERRLLVTSHDSFSYLAALYGFEIVGLVIPSLATHVEPSAEHIASVIDVVRERDVPSSFWRDDSQREAGASHSRGNGRAAGSGSIPVRLGRRAAGLTLTLGWCAQTWNASSRH